VREGDRERGRRAGRGEDRGGRLEGGQVKVGSPTVLHPWALIQNGEV
jgi:hypothetical protein